jgi:hypothetical protein
MGDVRSSAKCLPKVAKAEGLDARHHPRPSRLQLPRRVPSVRPQCRVSVEPLNDFVGKPHSLAELEPADVRAEVEDGARIGA